MNIFMVNSDSNRRLVIPETDFALPITSHVQRLMGNRTSVRLGVRPWGIHVSREPDPIRSQCLRNGLRG